VRCGHAELGVRDAVGEVQFGVPRACGDRAGVRGGRDRVECVRPRDEPRRPELRGRVLRRRLGAVEGIDQREHRAHDGTCRQPACAEPRRERRAHAVVGAECVDLGDRGARARAEGGRVDRDDRPEGVADDDDRVPGRARLGLGDDAHDVGRLAAAQRAPPGRVAVAAKVGQRDERGARKPR